MFFLVKNSLGNTTFPSFGINSIGNWNVEEGYKLKTASSTTLVIGCEQTDPTNYLISVQIGWSIIAYLRTSGMDIATALNNIVADILIVKDGDGNTYIPAFGINIIGNMIPGQGYKIKMASGATLTYPGN